VTDAPHISNYHTLGSSSREHNSVLQLAFGDREDDGHRSPVAQKDLRAFLDD
jgi:hypothetical protein